MAQYLFPANYGWFMGTMDELMSFASREQKEDLSKREFLRMHPKIVALESPFANNEDRIGEYLAQFEVGLEEKIKPITWH